MTPDRLTIGRLSSPVGELLLVFDISEVLLACDYGDFQDRLHRLLTRRLGVCRPGAGAVPVAVVRALDAYFAGDLTAIDDVPVRLNGSSFQNCAWQALRRIPPGQPVSYSEQAARMGHPGAARAVGHANHNNPYNLIVPCHRIVGANGALTGYAGGLERKRWLLDHEDRHANRSDRLL